MRETRKYCWHCKQVKPLEAFAKAKRTPDGLQQKCRECAKEYMTAYRASNAERIKALNAKHNAKRGQSKELTLFQAMHNMVRAGQ